MSERERAATLREIRQLESLIARKMRLSYDDNSSKEVRELLQAELVGLQTRKRELAELLRSNG